MSTVVTIKPEDLRKGFAFSKGNNRKNNSLDIRDASGKPLKGKIRRTLLTGLQLQQQRYNTKRLEAELLTIEDLKVKVDGVVNGTLKISSTDKQAILDGYYMKSFTDYGKCSLEELDTISLEANLDEIQKQALINAYQQLKGNS